MLTWRWKTVPYVTLVLFKCHNGSCTRVNYYTVPSSSFKFPENTPPMIRILWVRCSSILKPELLYLQSQVNSRCFNHVMTWTATPLWIILMYSLSCCSDKPYNKLQIHHKAAVIYKPLMSNSFCPLKNIHRIRARSACCFGLLLIKWLCC